MLQGVLACNRHENQHISLLNNQCYLLKEAVCVCMCVCVCGGGGGGGGGLIF